MAGIFYLSVIDPGFLVVVLLSLGVVRYLTGKSSYYFDQQQKTMGMVSSCNEEMLNGRVIKVFSMNRKSRPTLTLQ